MELVGTRKKRVTGSVGNGERAAEGKDGWATVM